MQENYRKLTECDTTIILFSGDCLDEPKGPAELQNTAFPLLGQS